MNERTIKRVFTKKHNDFVRSIDDPQIAKLVDKKSIITGGAIVSMLLNERPKDYDYYFTDKDTCEKVARYFVDKFNERNESTQAFVVVGEERIRLDFTEKAGFAAGELSLDDRMDAADILTPEDEEVDILNIENIPAAAAAAAEENTETKSRYRPVFLSANAITLSNDIQLIVRFYGSAEEIHKNYDFVHCTCAWESSAGSLSLPAAALTSILTRELIYTGSKYPLASIMRMRKFIKRGWHINAGQILKMVLQTNQLNLFDITTLRDQLVGVDSAYFAAILNNIQRRVEEDDQFKLTSNYLIEVINRIF